MKSFYRLIPFVLLLLNVLPLSAQIGDITPSSIVYEKEQVDVLSVTIQPERKDVQKAFDDWLDDRYDINMKGGGLFGDKNIRSAEGVTIPGISPENITLFTETEARGGATRMSIFASKGLENYIDRTETQAFAGLQNLFDDFLSSYLPEYHNQQVAATQERLQDLREAFAETEEDIVKNENRIEKLQQENVEFRTNLRELTRKIEAAQRELSERKSKRRSITNAVSNNG